MEKKECLRCQKHKPLDAFYTNRRPTRRKGHKRLARSPYPMDRVCISSQCKDCKAVENSQRQRNARKQSEYFYWSGWTAPVEEIDQELRRIAA